jgi:hypothetical protein
MLSVVSQRLPARQLRVADAQHPAVGNLADHLAWWGAEERCSALPAQRELDDQVGLVGTAHDDVRFRVRVKSDREVHPRLLGRGRRDGGRHDAEVDAARCVCLLTDECARERLDLRPAKGAIDDRKHIDVTPPWDVVAERQRPMEDH